MPRQIAMAATRMYWMIGKSRKESLLFAPCADIAFWCLPDCKLAVRKGPTVRGTLLMRLHNECLAGGRQSEIVFTFAQFNIERSSMGWTIVHPMPL
jgi:hypothetical protein